MSEPLIPTQIINPVIPSIASISSCILSTSVESATKEHNVTIDDVSSFVDKDDMANFHNNVLHRAKESDDAMLKQPKKTRLLRTMIS